MFYIYNLITNKNRNQYSCENFKNQRTISIKAARNIAIKIFRKISFIYFSNGIIANITMIKAHLAIIQRTHKFMYRIIEYICRYIHRIGILCAFM